VIYSGSSNINSKTLMASLMVVASATLFLGSGRFMISNLLKIGKVAPDCFVKGIDKTACYPKSPARALWKIWTSIA
jgi:hypothetical protein